MSFATARLDQDKSSERQCLPQKKPGFRGHSSSSHELREKIEADNGKFVWLFELEGEEKKKSPTNVSVQPF